MLVSFYSTIKATTGVEMELAQVLAGIRQGTWQAAAAAVRAAPTKAAQRAAKLRVPYFTASGTFAPRSEAGLRQHSGLLALDLDFDPNAGLDWPATRAALQADAHTWACFTSVSGRGLCLLVGAHPGQHRASYHAARAYYEQRYGVVVDALPDVSRPRFVSFDPALYHAPGAATLPLPPTLAEAAEAPAPPPLAPLAPLAPPGPAAPAAPDPGYGPAALRLAVRRVLEAPDGQKHHTLNKMAYLCGGYVASGLLPAPAAEAALRQAIGQRRPADLAAAYATIAAGLLAGQRRPLLPDHLQYAVRTQRRAGQPAEAVLARLATTPGALPPAVLRPAVQAVYEEEELSLSTFWDVVPREGRGGPPGGPPVLLLNRAKYLAWLANEGFALHRQGTRYQPVHVHDNVVREVTRAELKQHVLAYVGELPFEFDGIFRRTLEDRIQREHRQLFEEGTLEFLPPVGDHFVRDTKHTAYFFFQNAWVEVTAAGLRPRPYAELPGLIWAGQRLPRDFTAAAPGPAPSLAPGAAEASGGEFGRYLGHLTGGCPARFEALATALGYLLHRHRARTACYAVVLCDEAIGRGGMAGRTGKGLLVQALEKLRQVVKLDGKNFDINRQFAWQRVRHDTDLVVLDDLDARRLPFDKLFSIITTGMEVETKGGMQQYIDFYDAPKLLISTNDTLVGEGPSHEGRKIELEIASYYSPRHTPREEFGHELFDDWDAAEWGRFDHLLLGCTQRYLAQGVRRAPVLNLPQRKLMQKTCEEFAEFADQEIALGQWYGKRSLWQLFRDTHGFDERLCSQRRFNGWLKDLAYYKSYQLQEQRQTAGFLPGQRDIDVRFDPQPA